MIWKNHKMEQAGEQYSNQPIIFCLTMNLMQLLELLGSINVFQVSFTFLLLQKKQLLTHKTV